MSNHFNKHFTGERALFKEKDSYIESCLFDDGESPLKESRDIDVVDCVFGWEYPIWYSQDVNVIDSKFLEMARSGPWYMNRGGFTHCEFSNPKSFRKCEDISIEDCTFHDGKETFWWSSNIKIRDSEIKEADYFAMKSKNIEMDHVKLRGNYCFDGGQNIVIKDSVLLSKDAFWNCKKVRLENCFIDGEYFGWNSEDVTLVHCEVHSHQGFCYMKNVKLIDCRFIGDLSFEYCEDIDAEIHSHIDSIKNPISGRIECNSVGEIIRDDDSLDHDRTQIITHEE